MKSNRKLARFLAIVLIGVWGTIAYRVISEIYLSNEDDLSAASEDAMNKTAKLADYHYSDDVRDPFRYFIPIKKANIPKKVVTLPVALVWVPPPYRLTGIVMNENKRTALLEGNDGSVSFLQEGDSLSGVQILKISEKQVTYTYQKRTGEWSLR